MGTILRVLAGIMAVIIWVGGAVAGLWTSFYFMLYGGIMQAINAFHATPVDSSGAAIGIIRAVFFGLPGGIVFWVCVMIGAVFMAMATAGLDKPTGPIGGFKVRRAKAPWER